MELIIRKSYIFARNARDWLIAKAFFSLVAVLKLLPADRAIAFISEATRLIGRHYPRTKLARTNLRLAFPDKSSDEIERIISGMWANLGRTGAEYIYLDQIFDINEEDQSKGRVEIVGEEHFYRLRDSNKPAVCFTGHTGNWEILPIASAVYGLNITALFRPPNNKYIAERVLSARTTSMGHLVPSKAGASWALARVMDDGGKVGMLVDQFFARGFEIDFLGRQTMANPLLAKLVRQYDCDVYPARCVRLPKGRFRIEIEAPLEIPRLPGGAVDAQTLTQSVNDVVARWVKEHPDQWLWLHKRWRPEFMARRANQSKQNKKKTPNR